MLFSSVMDSHKELMHTFTFFFFFSDVYHSFHSPLLAATLVPSSGKQKSSFWRRRQCFGCWKQKIVIWGICAVYESLFQLVSLFIHACLCMFTSLPGTGVNCEELWINCPRRHCYSRFYGLHEGTGKGCLSLHYFHFLAVKFTSCNADLLIMVVTV